MQQDNTKVWVGFFVLVLSGVMAQPLIAQQRSFSQAERCQFLTVFDAKDSFANLRQSPNGKVLTRIPNGSLVNTVDGRARIQPGWTAIRLPTMRGYIASTLLHRSVYRVIDPQDKTVNLRSSPNGQVITSIPNDTEVMFLGKSGDGRWSRVRLASGKIGFIFAKFLLPPNCGLG
jgi:hypothetical protein